MLYTYNPLVLTIEVMGLGAAVYAAFRLLDFVEKRRTQQIFAVLSRGCYRAPLS